MKSTYDPERVLQVVCPSCDAQAGEQCRSKSGKARQRHDYHAPRKGIIYPEFGSKRGGLSDPSRKAQNVLASLDRYLDMRARLAASDHQRGFEEVAKARDALFEALKKICK